ncbi:MAG: hypothetical protein CL943_03735 [Candidatus Diapherotrites archaeon]|uniref:Ribonuclease n=1 Tax=Candidatus Iainarchaeum sp. TaxID=3101447 RepID=A0A2D6M1U6_9ARCH|nr:hypothetical protein [Candidatus Diapherotrites archaeon]|tara:strand:+ start:677 stop:1360 length:684 start_codon:yes stop_codon:yes gene_type:complete
MNISLNFSEQEKKTVKEYLAGFEALETKTQYEDVRVKIGESVVTLYTSGKLLIQGEDAEKTKDILLHNIGSVGELLVGIDETGRGENFGPFVVAGVLGNTNELRELRDSKKIGKIGRAKKVVLKHSKGHLVLSKRAGEIDSLRGKGRTMNDIELEMIAEIVQNFREKGFKGRILVDGSPLNQGLEGVEFMPKADDLNPVVGAASVLAKAARDKSKDKEIRKSWRTDN